MTNNNSSNKEYNSIVLGALLHDIGKFLQRQVGVESKKHQEFSVDFIDEYLSKIIDDKKHEVDIDLVRLFCKRHHEDPRIGNDYLVQKIEDPEKRRLAYIVSRADNFSSSERSVEVYRKYFKKTPLESIFRDIDIGRGRVEINREEGDNYWRYDAKKLDPKESFPISEKKDFGKEDKEINKLVIPFINDFKQLQDKNDFNSLYETLLSLLEQYLWCIPSDTRHCPTDISLYDHLKTTSAIAACMYKYHKEKNLFEEKNIKNNAEKRFILVGGDLCGIQEFIYIISNSGTGGAAKRLRARSFYVSIFVEVVIYQILKRLKLPSSCNLVNAGGKFLLLVPNTENTIRLLKEYEEEISKWIFDKFFNQFYLNLVYDVGFEDDTLLSLSIEGYDLKTYNFFKIAERVIDRLEKKKKVKNNILLYSNAGWNEGYFTANRLYESYRGAKDCTVCGMGPAVCADDKDKNKGGEDDKEICEECHTEKYIIGTNLPRTKYISFFNNNIDEGRKKSFEINNTCITLWDTFPDKFDIAFDITGTRANNDFFLTSARGVKKYFLANHIPRFDDKKNRKVLCDTKCNKRSVCEIKDSDILIYSFQCIAAESMDYNKGTETPKGTPLLGVLKADIDNLGLIFSKGFEEWGKKDEREEIDRKTVSRYLTLSRMIELFFSGWIKDILETDDKFKKIYTVYSGGDDLVLVGPWNTMIDFSVVLYKRFREFTCYNNNMTLSAGIAIVKPMSPISDAIKLADKYLQRSKDFDFKKGCSDRSDCKDCIECKDRLTFFNTTIKWKDFEKLEEFKNKLSGFLNDEDSPIKAGFIFRLLKYHEMFLKFQNEGDIKSLMYLPHMKYDIGRNIIKRDKNGNIIEGQTEFNELTKLLELSNDNFYMKNLKIPVYWTIYENR